MQPSHVELAARRRRAGASRETMAAGIGLDVEEVRAIEEGRGAEAQSVRYGEWLDRVEAWSPEQRSQQFKIAGIGQRFQEV
jgi:DNA-binding XRE family transcriptional regulator